MSEESVSNMPNAASMSTALGAILKDPELLEKIRTLVSGASISNLSTNESAVEASAQNAKASSNAGRETAAEADQTDRPVSSDGLSSLLSNPAVMEQLPQMVAILRPMLAASTPPAEAKAVIAQAPSPALCRDNLLLALKPFLSPSRRDAVDTMLRIAKLGSVFEQLR